MKKHELKKVKIDYSKTKIASEKFFNRHIFPVIKVVHHNEIHYPYTASWGSDNMVCTQGVMGPRHMMILDALGTYVIHYYQKMIYKRNVIDFYDRLPTCRDNAVKRLSGAFISFELLQHVLKESRKSSDGKIPPEWYDDAKLLKNVDAFWGRMKKVVTITIDDSTLVKELPYLKRYSSLKLMELIVQTSEFKVMMHYPIRYFDGQSFQTFYFDNGGNPCSFFTIDSIRESRISKNGNVLKREYIISFDTFLGYFFIQNCISAYTDLLPMRFYELSGFSQLFYRLLVLPYFGKVKNPIWLDEVQARLQLKTKNKSMIRTIMRRILEELEDKGFIEEPREEKINKEYRYGYKKKSWSEMNENKE